MGPVGWARRAVGEREGVGTKTVHRSGGYSRAKGEATNQGEEGRMEEDTRRRVIEL